LSSSRCAWSEPEEEPGHLPPKRPVSRAPPRRLVDLFGEVHDPRLKPEGLVETVGDLAEVRVHGRLLAWRVLVMGMWVSSVAALPCGSTTNCGGLLSRPWTLLGPSGEPLSEFRHVAVSFLQSPFD
jgi:hypothetical protein